MRTLGNRTSIRPRWRSTKGTGLTQIALIVALLLVAMTGAAVAADLVEGLDGGEYEAYKPSVIEKVQTALQQKGLYEGDIDGRLSEATMQAIRTFQEQHGIQPSGVPSPYTRQALFDGETEQHAERN